MFECKLTQEQCAERVGKKRSTVANFLRLLKLPEEIQSALKINQISMGHARALVNVKDKQSQINMFNDTIENAHSVRILEQMVRTFAETGYKQTSKNSRKNNTILSTLPFSSQQALHKLGKSLEKEINAYLDALLVFANIDSPKKQLPIAIVVGNCHWQLPMELPLATANGNCNWQLPRTPDATVCRKDQYNNIFIIMCK